MDPVVIVIIVVAVLIVLAILAMTVFNPRKRAERRLRQERQRAAEHHRSEAEERKERATVADQRAEEARLHAERAAQEARLEREHASLHENRADLTERGLADDELGSEQYSVRDREGDGRADADDLGATRATDEPRGRFTRESESVDGSGEGTVHRAPRS
jgi:septal ring factor EnvC (AmiA/AmiB activator)